MNKYVEWFLVYGVRACGVRLDFFLSESLSFYD